MKIRWALFKEIMKIRNKIWNILILLQQIKLKKLNFKISTWNFYALLYYGLYNSNMMKLELKK